MRNAGDRAAPGGRPPGTPREAGAGGRHTGSSGRPRDTGEQAPPGPGGPSLFTPAYRVTHADPSGQPDPRGAGPAGYRDAADASGSGYPWTDDAQGQARGGYGGAGYGGAGQGGAGYGGADQGGAGYGGAGQGGAGYGGAGYDRAGLDRAGYGAAADGPAWPDDELGSPYSWSTGDPDAWPGTSLPDTRTQHVMSNAVRGFPPAPGDPLPVYPPGPFAAWNRGQPGRQDGRAGRAGGRSERSQLATATITPDEFDTDYSLPAIKDPLPGQAGKPAGPDRRAATATGTGPVQKVRGDQLAPDAGRPVRGSGSRAKDRSGRQQARGRKKRQPAWLAIGAACVIIGAVAAILVVTIPRGTTPPSHHKPNGTPTPASSSPTPPPGQWGFIGSRATDPVPLTAAELFPATVSSHLVVYTRAKQAKSAKCRAALIGAALQAAVKRGGCTQALRATYLSKTAKVMGTIGVFNLKGATAATRAAGKAGHAEFVAQLAAKSGPAKAIGQGTGIEEAIVKGHYLVLVWAETTNLSAPQGQAGRAKLTAFMNLLVNRTVNLSLSNRMVDGKPVPPG